jgi:hypothetical protein
MERPLSFQPLKQDVNFIPIDTHNEIVKELEHVKNELTRCRQKVAHLLKEQDRRTTGRETV